MAPCPTHTKGRHDLVLVVPEDDDHDLLIVCERCGAVKRESISVPRPLDDLSPEVIRSLTA